MPSAVSDEDLALASLDLLRAFATIADGSLDATVPRISFQQARALTLLHERGPLQATRLATALGIAPSTLTRLADRLVRDGLVERVADPDDRRAVLLSESRKGARLAERVKAWRLAELARRFTVVADGKERVAMLAAVRQLAGVLTTPVPPRRRSR